MAIIAAPTGAGKTTTLYSIVDYLNSPEINITTIEDPVEIRIDGLNQIEIGNKATFSGALRTVLRQDPDIILLGEIRDKETAEIAVQAGQTGHYVLSTIHTIDSIEVINRLRKMGLSDYDIASTLATSVSQRLVRRICPDCKREREFTQEEKDIITKIAEKYGIPHISTGDIFRANIKNGTELGKKAKTYMDQGLLVPDELTCDLVVDRIQQDDAKNGYVLDGFPRTIPQAECLTAALEKLGSKIDYAIDVDVPDDNIVNRMSGRRACLKCGATYHIVYAAPKVENVCDTCGENLVLRDDDKPETVSKRLKVYHEQTQPLIDYYTKQGVLKTVDGTAALDKVFQAIVEILGE